MRTHRSSVFPTAGDLTLFLAISVVPALFDHVWYRTAYFYEQYDTAFVKTPASASMRIHVRVRILLRSGTVFVSFICTLPRIGVEPH